MKPIEQIADYKEALEVLNQDYAAMGWEAETKSHGLSRKDTWDHYSFTITFRDKESFPWMQGTGIETQPNPAEVLARICSDYRDVKESNFIQWREDFGYTGNLEESAKVYKKCKSFGFQLKSLGLNMEQIYRFADLSSML